MGLLTRRFRGEVAGRPQKTHIAKQALGTTHGGAGQPPQHEQPWRYRPAYGGGVEWYFDGTPVHSSKSFLSLQAAKEDAINHGMPMGHLLRPGRLR